VCLHGLFSSIVRGSVHLDAADRMREVRGLDVVTWPRTGGGAGCGQVGRNAWGGGFWAGGQPVARDPDCETWYECHHHVALLPNDKMYQDFGV